MFLFGIRHDRPTRAAARKMDRIAKSHGARLIEADLPTGYQRWFSAKNMGQPFDGWTRDKVLADLRAAGLEEAE